MSYNDLVKDPLKQKTIFVIIEYYDTVSTSIKKLYISNNYFVGLDNGTSGNEINYESRLLNIPYFEQEIDFIKNEVIIKNDLSLKLINNDNFYATELENGIFKNRKVHIYSHVEGLAISSSIKLATATIKEFEYNDDEIFIKLSDINLYNKNNSKNMSLYTDSDGIVTPEDKEEYKQIVLGKVDKLSLKNIRNFEQDTFNILDNGITLSDFDGFKLTINNLTEFLKYFKKDDEFQIEDVTGYYGDTFKILDIDIQASKITIYQYESGIGASITLPGGVGNYPLTTFSNKKIKINQNSNQLTSNKYLVSTNKTLDYFEISGTATAGNKYISTSQDLSFLNAGDVIRVDFYNGASLVDYKSYELTVNYFDLAGGKLYIIEELFENLPHATYTTKLKYFYIQKINVKGVNFYNRWNKTIINPDSYSNYSSASAWTSLNSEYEFDASGNNIFVRVDSTYGGSYYQSAKGNRLTFSMAEIIQYHKTASVQDDGHVIDFGNGCKAWLNNLGGGSGGGSGEYVTININKTTGSYSKTYTSLAAWADLFTFNIPDTYSFSTFVADFNSSTTLWELVIFSGSSMVIGTNFSTNCNADSGNLVASVFQYQNSENTVIEVATGVAHHSRVNTMFNDLQSNGTYYPPLSFERPVGGNYILTSSEFGSFQLYGGQKNKPYFTFINTNNAGSTDQINYLIYLSDTSADGIRPDIFSNWDVSEGTINIAIEVVISSGDTSDDVADKIVTKLQTLHRTAPYQFVCFKTNFAELTIKNTYDSFVEGSFSYAYPSGSVYEYNYKNIFNTSIESSNLVLEIDKLKVDMYFKDINDDFFDPKDNLGFIYSYYIQNYLFYRLVRNFTIIGSAGANDKEKRKIQMNSYLSDTKLPDNLEVGDILHLNAYDLLTFGENGKSCNSVYVTEIDSSNNCFYVNRALTEFNNNTYETYLIAYKPQNIQEDDIYATYYDEFSHFSDLLSETLTNIYDITDFSSTDLTSLKTNYPEFLTNLVISDIDELYKVLNSYLSSFSLASFIDINGDIRFKFINPFNLTATSTISFYDYYSQEMNFKDFEYNEVIINYEYDYINNNYRSSKTQLDSVIDSLQSTLNFYNQKEIDTKIISDIFSTTYSGKTLQNIITKKYFMQQKIVKIIAKEGLLSYNLFDIVNISDSDKIDSTKNFIVVKKRTNGKDTELTLLNLKEIV